MQNRKGCRRSSPCIKMLPALAVGDPGQAALSTLQIDRRALHFGLGILRLDRDRLLVPTRHQAQIGGKCRSLGHDLKASAFDLAGHGAGSIACGFTPTPCDCTAP